MNDVERSPLANVESAKTACMKEIFVETPRIRNSASARSARITAELKSRPLAISFTSSESKCGLTSLPAEIVPPSRRIPAPPGER